MIPFKYGRVVCGRDFCGRKASIKELSEYIRSAQNIVLQGERRIGKTSLIVETASKLKKQKLLTVDLMAIKSSNDLCHRIIKAIIQLESGGSFLAKTLKLLSHLRPQIGIDPISNLPTISIDSSVQLAPDSLEEVFDLIQKLNQKKDLIIFLDEFQDVLNIPDSKQIMAILRSKVQYHDTIAYIFAGSIRNQMDEIFINPDSPLFKSALPLTLQAIDENEFSKFIKNKFAQGNREIPDLLLTRIYSYCDGITGDIQQLCEALWSISEGGEIIEENHFSAAFELIFSREWRAYELVMNELTEIQTKCLIGLANTDGFLPTSASFLKHTGIQQPSTVRKALTKLQKRNVIFKYEKRYRFVNPFFKSWLLFKGL